jgi:hypothetical protein
VGARASPIVLGCSYHFLGTLFCGLPIAQLDTILDHLFLAGYAMAAVLFVGLLETAESKHRFALA